MWTRAEIKKRAWNGLKPYYWKAVLMVVLAGLLGSLSAIPYVIAVLFFTVCFCVAPLAPFAGCILNGFYGDILGLGTIRFYLDNIKGGKDVPVSVLFSGFQTGHYKNSGKILTFRNIFLSLWYMLLVIPGIVKGYEYRMIPFLIAEYPEKGQDEIFALSKQMMDGNKKKVFVLDLSLMGWGLLSAITFGIGGLFILPYLNAVNTELYLTLKEERLGQPRGSDYNLDDKNGGNILLSPVTDGKIEEDEPTIDMNQASVTRPVIIGIQGEYAGAEIFMESGKAIIVGRDPSKCNLVFNSKGVSRLHLEITYSQDRFRVTDHSTYGTFDLEQGQLPKDKTVFVKPGSSLKLGTGNDVLRLDIR